MAHVELFAQRKWAFELRLRQLNYLFTSQIPLEEIAREQNHRLSRFSAGKQRDEDETDEAAFLHTDQSMTASTQVTRTSRDPQDNLAAADALSAASNPLIAANAHSFAAIFPCSPIGTDRPGATSQDCFPSPPQLASLISGRPYKLCSLIMQNTPSETVADKLYDRLNRDACAVGCQSIFRCTERILNGAYWPWLYEVTRLVREQLLQGVHYLPALLKKPSPAPRSNTWKRVRLILSLVIVHSVHINSCNLSPLYVFLWPHVVSFKQFLHGVLQIWW